MHCPAEWNVDAHGKVGVERWNGDGAVSDEDLVAEEVPVALVYGGVSHAVMLTTPQDLEDFALGFSLSESILTRPGELYDLEVVPGRGGIELRMEIASERMAALKAHRRALAGRTGCGLCGVDSLDQLARRAAVHRLPGNRLPMQVSASMLQRAIDELQATQPLFALTGAVHAAAWCDARGAVQLVREDVGRHNALDKLIGARFAARQTDTDGFVLITSRASYEIVQKAATVGIGVIAAMSAPTGMAVRMADGAGVTLIGFARGGRFSVYAHGGPQH